MDCRSFHRKHLAYLDDTLSGVDTRAMREHVRVCASCSRHDASVRRALLVVRNLPAVTPSPDFSRRLMGRLASEGATTEPWSVAAARGPSVGLFVSVAASVVLVGALVTLAAPGVNRGEPRYATLPAVVVETPASPAIPVQLDAAPAFVASMSTGMPMWSALLFAEEGSVRLAQTALQPASWSSEAPPR